MFADHGSTYIRWGRTQCEGTHTELVYSGIYIFVFSPLQSTNILFSFQHFANNSVMRIAIRETFHSRLQIICNMTEVHSLQIKET